MALTVANLQRSGLTNKRLHVAKITFDSSYATGGESLTARMLALASIDVLEFSHVDGYSFEWDSTNKKVKVFSNPTVTVTGGQGAGTALQIDPDTNAGVLGKTAATTRTIPGGTFGISRPSEVPSGTNLSTLSTTVRAIGI